MAKPSVVIRYCPKCNWLLRSAWMAQELLNTFEDDLAGVTLEPSETAGEFEILFGGDSLWERKRDAGFPSVKELKQRVRDRLDPDRDLGHLDR